MYRNEEEILEGLKNNEKGALRALFDGYYRPLCLYSFKYCDDFALAEDIVQEFFINFWKKKQYEKIDSRFMPYFFKSIKNNTLQALAKKSKLKLVAIEEHLNDVKFEELTDADLAKTRRDALFKEIEALPEKSREVFKLIVLDGARYKEAAEQLNVSVNTVKTHYSRALKQLRSSLDTIILLLLLNKI